MTEAAAHPCTSEHCPQPAPPDAFLCNSHTAALTAALTWLADHAHELVTTATRQDRVRPATDRPHPHHAAAYVCPACNLDHDGRGTVDNYIAGEPHASPVNLAAAQLHRDATRWLIANLGARPHQAPPDWIARRVATIRALEWSGRCHDAAVDYRRRITRTIDTRPEKIYFGRCEVDDCPADIYAEPGKREAVCDRCHATHDLAERRAHLDQLVLDILLPLNELRTYARQRWGIAPSRQQLYAWRVRNHLIAKGQRTEADNGRVTVVDLYRIGDLVGLATRLPVAQTAGR